jgi:hypothetical protein
MSVPFAPGPKRDGIFAEVVFGALGLGVLASTLLTLASTPTVGESVAAPGAVAAAVWSTDSVVTHLVDVSMIAEVLTAPDEPEPEPEAEAEAPLGEGEADEEPVREGEPSARAPEREAARAQGEAEDPDPGAKGATEGAAKPSAKKGRRCTETADSAIVSTAPGRWTVDQSVVRRYTRDWSRLDQLGWSRSHKDAQGRNDGLELGGIRCGSDIYDAGFRNGDVIHTVNGRKVHSIPQAVIAYGALHNDKSFSVEITRRGKRQVLTYRLVD